jgi:outer membrane lipoprotein-sorting protein
LSPRRPSTRGACRNLIRWLLLAVVPAAIVGCSTVARQIPSPPQLELEQPPVTGWTADKLAGILSHRDRQFQSLRALASVSYRGPGGTQGFQEAVLVQRPDKVRLETLSLLGAILIITVNGDEIVGFHPRERLYLRGKSTKENLYRYTGIPFELQEMTRLLAGLPPVMNSAKWQIGGNSLYRELDGGGKEIVVFDLAREIPVRWYRLGPDGSAELSAAFENFSSTSAGLFPSNITLEAETAAQKRSLEIVYQEPEVNVEIAPSLFDQEKPPNAKEVPIEALVR